MKVLIVKTSALGDVIHAFPVVAYIKSRFPDAQIDWIVEEQCSELVRAHPDIHRTLTVKTKAWRKAPFSSQTWQEIRSFRKMLREEKYDCIIDLQGNIKSGLLTMQANGIHKIGFGSKSVPEWPNLLFSNTRFNPPSGNNIRKDYLYIVQSFFKDDKPFEGIGVKLKITPEQLQAIDRLLENPILKGRKKVMICPGSAWQNKQMTPEGLLELMQKIQPELQCSFLLVWGSKDEQAIVQKLNTHFPNNSVIVERMPLPALQNLMGKVDLVIAMDSLPLHLAGTTATSTYGIFGASLADKYQPIGKNCHAIQGACPYGRTFEKRCPILRTCPTGSCIRNLSGSTVFSHFQQTIKK